MRKKSPLKGTPAVGFTRLFCLARAFMPGRGRGELFPDQPAGTEEIFLEHLRQITPWGKLQIVMDRNRRLQLEAIAEIQARYGPNVSEQELQLRLASSWLDRETMLKVYSWDPAAYPTDIDFESLRERVDRVGMDDLLRQALEDSGITTG